VKTGLFHLVKVVVCLSVAAVAGVTLFATALANAGALRVEHALVDHSPCPASGLRLLEAARRLSDSAAGTDHLLAECALQSRQWQTAVDLLTRAYRRSAQPLYLHRRGDALSESGRRSEALEDWRRSGSVDVLQRRGETAAHALYLRDALAWFEIVTDLEPRRAEAYRWKGVVQQELGQLDSAEVAFRRAAELSPHDLQTQLSWAGFVGGVRHDYARAETLLAAMREEWPRRVEPALLTGQIMSAQKRYQEAVRWYDQAEALDPSSPQPALLRGVDLMSQDRMADALPLLRRANTLARDTDPFIHHNIGFALVQTGQVQASLVEFETAVRAAPRYVPFRVSAGQAHEQANRPCDALRHYRAAAEVDPANNWLAERLVLVTDGCHRAHE